MFYPQLIMVLKLLGISMASVNSSATLAGWLGLAAMLGCHSLSSDEGWPDCRAVTSTVSLGVHGHGLLWSTQALGWDQLEMYAAATDSPAFKVLQSVQP